jgi:hypothetical protein
LGHKLNKSGRDPLDDAVFQIANLYALRVWRRFLKIYYITLCNKTSDPQGRAIFDPRGIV